MLFSILFEYLETWCEFYVSEDSSGHEIPSLLSKQY